MNAQPFGPAHPGGELLLIKARAALRAVLVIVGGTGLYFAGAWSVARPVVVSENAVKASLLAYLPDLKISDIDCRAKPDRCQVTAGEVVLMTDHAGKTIYLGESVNPRVQDLMVRKEWRRFEDRLRERAPR
jgi:hypothetical protein